MGRDLRIETRCNTCLKPLTLAEMHFGDNGNGEATCDKCMAQMIGHALQVNANMNQPMPTFS